jgi:hypothetical protein
MWPAPGYSTVSTPVRQPEDIFGPGGSVDVVEPVMEQRVGSAAERLARLFTVTASIRMRVFRWGFLMLCRHVISP